MRDFASLPLSVALPWIVGTAAVLALWRGRREDGDGLLAIGYGYPLGAFAATLVLRGFDLAGVRWSLTLVALPMLVLAIALLGFARGSLAPRDRWNAARAAFATLPKGLRVLFWLCFALVGLRVAGLALEILWRPLLAWDAWSQWATKARVWYEFGWMTPFVSQPQWIAAPDAMQFVDMHPNYPATVPLLQVWTDLWLGRWDESLMNAPWIAIVIALGIAFYAQLRRAGGSAPKAMLFTYLLLSMPFLNVHVALAGIADIVLATTYGLATLAFWSWVRTRAWRDLALAAAMIALTVTIKVEGMLWALTLAPALLIARHRRAGLIVVAGLGVAALCYLAFGPAEVTLFGYVLRTHFTNVTLPLAQHLFVMDNWHLLFYAAVVVLIVRFRRLFATDLAPMTVTVLGALGFVFVVYYFSSAAGGVDDESLVNRLPLQMAPVLVFYLALLLQRPPTAVRTDETQRSIPLQPNAADA